MVRAGAPWRWLPTDFPPWEAVYQQTQRRMKAARGRAMTARSGRRAPRCTSPSSTLGHLLAFRVTAAEAQERDKVAALAKDVQAVTGESVGLAYVDQGYTGERPAATAA